MLYDQQMVLAENIFMKNVDCELATLVCFDRVSFWNKKMMPLTGMYEWVFSMIRSSSNNNNDHCFAVWSWSIKLLLELNVVCLLSCLCFKRVACTNAENILLCLLTIILGYFYSLFLVILKNRIVNLKCVFIQPLLLPSSVTTRGFHLEPNSLCQTKQIWRGLGKGDL